MSGSLKYSRLSRDAAVLLLDYQSGSTSLVQNFPPKRVDNNVMAVAACGIYFALAVILTTSFEEGLYGPPVPELKKMFLNAPSIARPDQINAWFRREFVDAAKKTGCKQIIIAGMMTEICVSFPALSAIEESQGHRSDFKETLE